LPAVRGSARCFPDVVGERVKPTRQEVFFFGTPPGDRRFTEEALPVWADHGTRFMYGIPGKRVARFKVADDSRGPVFDPTNGERTPTAGAMQNRPRLSSRTDSPD